MYISRIQIQNFRCFADTTVEFQPGVTVIVGENNAGKSALLTALSFLFGRSARSIGRYDFHQAPPADLLTPPVITITATLSASAGEPTDDLALVSTWMTKLTPGQWEATLTYRLCLPEKEHERFAKLARRLGHWEAVEQLLPAFVGRTYGGNPLSCNRADPDALSRFDFHFLDAIRDAESKMQLGGSPMLRRVLRQALDLGKEGDVAESAQDQFRSDANALIKQLQDRIDLTRALELSQLTGASIAGVPTLDGSVTELDMLAALRLMINGTSTGPLPLALNGLGYNNLLFIALALAHLESTTDMRLGENAKIYPILAIEEPEAHLHPALQYRLLKYIIERTQPDEKNPRPTRQAFVTTHSSHITAAAGLDNIVCLTAPSGTDGPKVAYPGRVFDGSSESKHYVERFLDATKSTLLFSKGVIFVEGISEQLLVPVLAEYLNSPLEDALVAVIGVGGTTVKHFLPLFGATSPVLARYALTNRRVACLVDADPYRFQKSDASATTSKPHKCFPYELRDVPSNEGSSQSETCKSIHALAKTTRNIRAFSGSKTLEYDLALANKSDLLVTPNCTYAAELREFVTTSNSSRCLTKSHSPELIAALANEESSCRPTEHPRFATYYVQRIGEDKGAHAFALSHALKENLQRKPTERVALVVPCHVTQAIVWATNKVSPSDSPAAAKP